MGRKKRERVNAADQSAGFGGTLGDLLKAQLGGAATSATSEAPVETPAAPAPEPPSGPYDLNQSGKIVLRRTRKGRGGRTVTLVQQVSASAEGLDQLARDLKKGLGCGASVEEDEVVLQGDQVERAQAWLQSQGARRVVVG